MRQSNQERVAPMTNDPVYPTLNVYCSSRVANQRVNNARFPLLKYR